MFIKIIQVGKVKENYINEAVNLYLKRLGPFVKIEVVTLDEVSPSKSFTKEKALEKEAVDILKHIEKDDFVLVLDEKGEELDSREFADFLNQKKSVGLKISFVIGGPYGTDEAIKKRANFRLSLSKMTFTHQMVRFFLLEQLYRAISIMQGKDYHH